MNATPIQLISPQALTATLAKYYEAPAQKRVIISKMTITNVGAAVEKVDVHVVPAGGTADASNLLLKQKRLDINQSFPVYQLEGQILSPGDTVWAKTDTAGSVLLMASGVTVV